MHLVGDLFANLQIEVGFYNLQNIKEDIIASAQISSKFTFKREISSSISYAISVI